MPLFLYSHNLVSLIIIIGYKKKWYIMYCFWWPLSARGHRQTWIWVWRPLLVAVLRRHWSTVPWAGSEWRPWCPVERMRMREREREREREKDRPIVDAPNNWIHTKAKKLYLCTTGSKSSTWKKKQLRAYLKISLCSYLSGEVGHQCSTDVDMKCSKSIFLWL